MSNFTEVTHILTAVENWLSLIRVWRSVSLSLGSLLLSSLPFVALAFSLSCSELPCIVSSATAFHLLNTQMSSPSDAVVNFPADEDLSRSLLEDKENVVTSVSAVQEIVHVEEVLVQDVSVVEIVGTGATAVSDFGSGVVTAPEDGVSLVEVDADVGTGVENTPPVSGIANSELADMQSADIAAAIEPVSVLEEVPAAAAAAEPAVSLEEDDDHRVLTSEAFPTKEDITFVDPSILPDSLPFEEVPPDDTIPLHAMADPSIAATVLAAAEDDERTAQEVQKAEELGAVTAEIVKDDEKKEEQETTVVRVVEESVSVLQTRVIVEEMVPSTGEVLAQNVTETTIVDRETMTETALPQAAAGIVDGSAIAFTGEKEETMAVEETAVKKRFRDETFVSEEARALAEQLPVAAADAVDEILAVAGEEGDVPAVKRVKSDAAAGGEVEADVEQNNGSSKVVDDTQMGEEHTGDVVQGGGADSLQQEEAGKEEEQMSAAELKLGPKLFLSSIELFSYLYDLLHGWVVNTDLNKVSSSLNFQFYNAANDVRVEAKSGVADQQFNAS